MFFRRPSGKQIYEVSLVSLSTIIAKIVTKCALVWVEVTHLQVINFVSIIELSIKQTGFLRSSTKTTEMLNFKSVLVKMF